MIQAVLTKFKLEKNCPWQLAKSQLKKAPPVRGLLAGYLTAQFFRAENLKKLAAVCAAGIGIAAATQAHADPCEAKVSGYRPGATVAGTIRYVGDGDGLCIEIEPRVWRSGGVIYRDGWSSDGSQLLEIRLADFFAPELHEEGGRAAKAALARYIGHRAVCTAVRGHNGSTRSYDRLVATCTVDGKPLAGLLRAAGVVEGGRGRAANRSTLWTNDYKRNLPR